MLPKVNITRDPGEKPRIGLHPLQRGECFRFVNWTDPSYFYMKTDVGYVALNTGECFPMGYASGIFREVQRVSVKMDVDMRVGH